MTPRGRLAPRPTPCSNPSMVERRGRVLFFIHQSSTDYRVRDESEIVIVSGRAGQWQSLILSGLRDCRPLCARHGAQPLLSRPRCNASTHAFSCHRHRFGCHIKRVYTCATRVVICSDRGQGWKRVQNASSPQRPSPPQPSSPSQPPQPPQPPASDRPPDITPVMRRR